MTIKRLGFAIAITAMLSLVVAGTKISRLTETTTFEPGAMFVVVTGATDKATRHIYATNLLYQLTNLPGFANFGATPGTNLTATNSTQFAVFESLANGVLRFSGIEQGSNIVMYRNGSNIVINASATGSGSGDSIVTSNGLMTIIVANDTTTSNALYLATYEHVGNTVFVDAINGNDSTATRGRADLPSATLTNATAIAQSGDQIFVLPGTYNNGTNKIALRSNVKWYFSPGAEVRMINGSNPDGLPMFHDEAGAVTNTGIYGYGAFYSTNDYGAILQPTNQGSRIYFEADIIEQHGQDAAIKRYGGNVTGKVRKRLFSNYDAWLDETSVWPHTNKVNFDASTADIEAGNSIIEVNKSFANEGDFYFRHGRSRKTSGDGGIEITYGCLVDGGIIALDHNSYVTGGGTNAGSHLNGGGNGIIRNMTLVANPTNTRPIIGFISNGGIGGSKLHFQGCLIIGATNSDPVFVHNGASTSGLIFENTTIAGGWNSTNAMRSTNAQTVRFIGASSANRPLHSNLTVEGYDAASRTWTFNQESHGTNLIMGVQRYPQLATNQMLFLGGASNVTGLGIGANLSISGGNLVASAAVATTNVTVMSAGHLLAGTMVVTNGGIIGGGLQLTSGGDLQLTGANLLMQDNGTWLNEAGETIVSNLTVNGNITSTDISNKVVVSAGPGISVAPTALGDAMNFTITALGGGSGGAGPFNVNQFSASTTHTNLKDGVELTNAVSRTSFRVTGYQTNTSDIILESGGLPGLWLSGVYFAPSITTYGSTLGIGFLNRQLTMNSNANRIAWGAAPYGDLGIRAGGGFDYLSGSNALLQASITNLGVFYNAGAQTNNNDISASGDFITSSGGRSVAISGADRLLAVTGGPLSVTSEGTEVLLVRSNAVIAKTNFTAEVAHTISGARYMEIDRLTNGQTTIPISPGNGPDYSITTSSNMTFTFSGTPVHGQRLSLIITNSGTTNIIATIPSAYSVQFGANATSWAVLATNYARLNYTYSTNELATGGMWRIDSVSEFEAILELVGDLAFGTNGNRIFLTNTAPSSSGFQASSMVLSNIVGSGAITNLQSASVTNTSLLSIVQNGTNTTGKIKTLISSTGITVFEQGNETIGIAIVSGGARNLSQSTIGVISAGNLISNLYANKFIQQISTAGTNAAAQTNLTVDFNTNYVSVSFTNNVSFTNFTGVTAGVVGSTAIHLLPQAINRTALWPASGGTQNGLYWFRTNAASTLWTTLTAGVHYVYSVQAIGTNIFPTLTAWQ